ncbi:MAG: ATP-binding protein [Rubrivivax sp.]|nr:MAG: ATP-binding protein [Rubrivivax sp.]
MSADPAAGNPYPGLRPFNVDEEDLFFGREAQVDAMVDKLAATHFLAVVGTSGSGKSSLVFCGLLPALHRGLMASTDGCWRVAVLRPGIQPIRALAQALGRPGVLPPTGAEELGFTPEELIEAKLRIGKLGLVDVYREALSRDDPRRNLLIVVDQFEELFRFQALAGAGATSSATSACASTSVSVSVSASASASAAMPGRAPGEGTAFVNLLSEVTKHPELALYVVVTMRSDFLGDCAQFFGLPEAINAGQYLVPRLTRDERRAAIEGPAHLRGAAIDPVLLTRLVNDLGDDPDQLSILQHALHRTWAHWAAASQSGVAARAPITMADYDSIGTMGGALNQHAEEAYGSLPEGRPRQLAELLFKAITDRGTDARGVRRPTRVDTLCAVLGTSVQELTPVVEAFRDSTRAFLMPPAGVPLLPATVVDISHESLMRVWRRLSEWGDDEAASAQIYRRLAESARLHGSDQALLLRGPELIAALAWHRRSKPSASWAERYGAGFQAAMAYLEASQRHAAWLRLLTWVTGMLGVAAVFAVFVFYAWRASETRELALASAKNQASAAVAQVAKVSQEKAVSDQVVSELFRSQDAQQYKPVAGAAAQGAGTAADPPLDPAAPPVYMQYGDSRQKDMALGLQRQLRRLGMYRATGAEAVDTAPKVTEVRYFAADDKIAAEALVARLKFWRMGSQVTAVLVNAGGLRPQPQQLEIWLRRVDVAQVGTLVQRLRGDDIDDRRAALSLLIDGYSAAPEAIAAALATLSPENYGGVSGEGVFNTLRFLSRSAPVAWSSDLEKQGAQLIAYLGDRRTTGAGARFSDATSKEIAALEALLEAVRARRPLPFGV